MSGLIEINGEEIEVFTENSTSDVALSAFSGYMGFTGEMASQYGGTPGKVVGLVFDVSGREKVNRLGVEVNNVVKK